jgi:hypothetical protein
MNASELTGITDAQAEILAKHAGRLFLDGLTGINRAVKTRGGN